MCSDNTSYIGMDTTQIQIPKIRIHCSSHTHSSLLPVTQLPQLDYFLRIWSTPAETKRKVRPDGKSRSSLCDNMLYLDWTGQDLVCSQSHAGTVTS